MDAAYSGTPTLRASASDPLALTVTAPEEPPPPGATGRIVADGPSLRLGPGGRVTLATIACDQGPCRLDARPEALRVGKRRFDADVSVPSVIADGGSILVRAALPKDARKALRKRGKGSLRVGISLSGAADPVASRTQFTLKPAARG